jgi:hypothetical protein
VRTCTRLQLYCGDLTRDIMKGPSQPRREEKQQRKLDRAAIGAEQRIVDPPTSDSPVVGE